MCQNTFVSYVQRLSFKAIINYVKNIKHQQKI